MQVRRPLRDLLNRVALRNEEFTIHVEAANLSKSAGSQRGTDFTLQPAPQIEEDGITVGTPRITEARPRRTAKSDATKPLLA